VEERTGHGPTFFAGLSKRVDLKLVDRLELGSGAVAMRYHREGSQSLIVAHRRRLSIHSSSHRVWNTPALIELLDANLNLIQLRAFRLSEGGDGLGCKKGSRPSSTLGECMVRSASRHPQRYGVWTRTDLAATAFIGSVLSFVRVVTRIKLHDCAIYMVVAAEIEKR